MCLLESETKDVELRRECITTLGYVSQAQLSAKVIPTFANTLIEVALSVAVCLLLSVCLSVYGTVSYQLSQRGRSVQNSPVGSGRNVGP